MLEYNVENLNIVIEIIKKNLSTDLLPKKWILKNKDNPMFGHCYNFAGCLYKIFGCKQVKLYRGFDGEIYHWWVQDNDGKIIDPSFEQYTTIGKLPPYNKAEKSYPLPLDYRKRINILYEKVINQLKNNTLTKSK